MVLDKSLSPGIQPPITHNCKVTGCWAEFSQCMCLHRSLSPTPMHTRACTCPSEADPPGGPGTPGVSGHWNAVAESLKSMGTCGQSHTALRGGCGGHHFTDKETEALRYISKFTRLIQGLDFKFSLSLSLSVLSLPLLLPNFPGATEASQHPLQTALSSLLAGPPRSM